MPTYIMDKEGARFILNGDFGPHCADCSQPSELLCDYPIGGGLTCDRSICEHHGQVVGDNMHYCNTHYREWQANNPDLPRTYQYTHLRLDNLPGYTETALTFLKERFDDSDTGDRSKNLTRMLRNSAIPLGIDASRVAESSIEDEPHESLAGGLAWCVEHGLIEVLWRKLPGKPALPHFAMTMDGLAVLEGKTVERG